MSNPSTVSSAPLLAHSDPGFKPQTVVPSAIRMRGGAKASGSPSAAVSASVSPASTLRGLQSKKLMTTFGETSLPNGWTRIKHPDFGVYYVHKEKDLSTSSDVLDSNIRALIMEGASVLQRSAASEALLKDQDVGLVLDVRHDDKGRPMATSYYCVSHAERRIFWLEGVGHDEVNIPCTSAKCSKSKGLKAHCIEAQYWKHCELFPTTFTVTKDVIRELKDILLQAAADRLLVKFSTSPYDKDALAYMLNLVKEIEADIRDGSGYPAWIIARFMALYNDGMLQSSYGQGDDYFDIDNSAPEHAPYKRPLLLATVAPFFFRSPDVFAAELYSFHENFYPERWSSFVRKVDQSIRDSNLLATVLLSTNVAFLAYNDQGKGSGVNDPTAAQIVTYISIVFSVGSIIIGLMIFKQYRATGADTPLGAVVVLKRILKSPFGLERLSIICCLPYVLLLWGLIAFLAALGIDFYKDTGIKVRIPTTAALSILFLCLFFCLYTAGPPDKEKEEQRLQKRRLKEGDTSEKV
ncbi:hypothetical protein JVU11DRAFT_3636 [Chiua virens]|nr:hypothetical protein JVU11DRAFT_3636 [Chiua virens]